MKDEWRRNVGSILVGCMLIQLSLISIFPTTPNTPIMNPGTDGDLPIDEEDRINTNNSISKPGQSFLSFEEALASWENFTQKDYLPDLEIDPTKVRYYQNISEVFELNPTQWDYISKNGFVVVDTEDFETIEDAFHFYWENDIPVFITTDTILHTFHLLFDQFLQDAENETLRPLLENMTSDFLYESEGVYDQVLDSGLKDAMKDVVIFFAVPAKLLETGDTIPPYVEEEVDEYVQKILEAKVHELYPGQDYTQYKPRGHYAGDPFLERYFRAMMWYGRKSYDMNKTEDVLRACLITIVLLQNDDAKSAWEILYDVTSFLIGQSDSLNHNDVSAAMKIALGAVDIDLLSENSNVEEVKEELKKDYYYRQRILSDIVYKDWWETEPIVFPKIFQFMGQRYIPDSEVMQSVMFDRVPVFGLERRGLPSSLDVMAAMGSPRAVHNLESELEKYNYEEQLKEAWASIQIKEEEYWNQSVYFGLLRSYKELISGEEGEEYPEFMRTAGWADEKLNTASGSYAELKHDTILYGKQPYSVGITCGTPDAMVEPYPSFYARMENLSRKMMELIANHFNANEPPGKTFLRAFEDFAFINRNLTTISIHELQGIPLTPEEVSFVRGVYVRYFIGGVCGPPEPDGWLPSLIRTAEISKKTKDARIVADIATDPGTELPVPSPPRVLHIATGYIRSVIVAYEKPDGDYYFFVGPVYSFYEFPLEGFERLNDDEWKELLESGGEPPNPSWTSSFVS